MWCIIQVGDALGNGTIRIYSRLDVGVRQLRNYNHPLLIRISSSLPQLAELSNDLSNLTVRHSLHN